MDREMVPLRAVIVGALAVCLAVAMAPWFSGGQEPVAMLAGGFALLLGALLVWRQPEARRLRWRPLGLAFAAFLGWAVLSLLWSANRYSTVVWVCEWALAGAGFAVAYVVAGEPRGREWLMRAYIWSAVAFCLVGLGMFFAGSYERFTGLFYWANPAAAYMIPAVLITTGRLRTAHGNAALVWAGALGLFWTSFLLTQSRGALLVLGFVMGAYVLVVAGNRRFWTTLVFTGVVGLVLSFGLAQLSTRVAHHSTNAVPGGRFAPAAKGESSSVSDRFYFMASALRMWWEHPLLGVGAGTYGDVHPQYQQRVISAASNAHNLYAEVGAELGIVGLIALAVVLMLLLAGVLRGAAANPELVPVVLGIFALLLHFGVDIDASYPALLLLLAVLAGLAYRQRQEVRGVVSWGGPAYVAVVLVPLVGLYMSSIAAMRGQVAQEDGDFPGAAAWYGQAHSGLTYNPDVVSAEGIDFYAVALGSGKDVKESGKLALERARQAQRLDPHDGQHHQLEGRVLEARGDLSGAVSAFQAALRLDPLNHPGYALDLAAAQQQSGDLEGAVRTARAMLALYPDTVVANRSVDETVRPALANLEALVGDIRLKQGRAAEADTAAKASLHLYPESLRGRALQLQVAKAVRDAQPAQ